VINLIFERPYCRIENVVDAEIAERQGVSRDLKQLTEIGVLEEKVVGRENTVGSGPGWMSIRERG
jgi:hypothetical protein